MLKYLQYLQKGILKYFFEDILKISTFIEFFKKFWLIKKNYPGKFIFKQNFSKISVFNNFFFNLFFYRIFRTVIFLRNLLKFSFSEVLEIYKI